MEWTGMDWNEQERSVNSAVELLFVVTEALTWELDKRSLLN